MSPWLHAHREAIAQTLRHFRDQPVSALLSVVAISVGLSLPIGGHIVVSNVRAFAGSASTDPQISVFLAPDTEALERAEIERRLRDLPGVKGFRFVAKDAALRALQSRTGSNDLMAGLNGNPLPDTYLITPRELASTAQAQLADSIRRLPKVAEVEIDALWSDRLSLLANTADTAVLGLGILMGLAMLAVSFSTIRLQVLTRAEEISVLRLFGATRAYIRRPFLYFGALQGIGAAFLAWVATSGTLLWLEPRLSAAMESYGMTGQLTGLTPADLSAFFGFSALVGLMGAGLASAEY